MLMSARRLTGSGSCAAKQLQSSLVVGKVGANSQWASAIPRSPAPRCEFATSRHAHHPSRTARPILARPERSANAPTVTDLAWQRHSSLRRWNSSASSTTQESKPVAALDWNTFFTLRKTRRRVQLVCSFVTMTAGLSVSGLLLLQMDNYDVLSKIPMDPMFSLALLTLGCTALGWLAGPSVGSLIFYSWKRGVKTPMAAKEAQFFARIKRNRVDPSVSSVSNPVPDYYGEKISSVAGYRQWLKDQRAFNKKRTSFV